MKRRRSQNGQIENNPVKNKENGDKGEKTCTKDMRMFGIAESKDGKMRITKNILKKEEKSA